MSFDKVVNFLIVNPSDGQAISANISGRGGGGGGASCHPIFKISTIACLNFLLLLTYRPILGLPEYELKVVNICEMHGTEGHEVVVFDRFQRYVEIVRKLMKKFYNSFVFQINDSKSTG